MAQVDFESVLAARTKTAEGEKLICTDCWDFDDSVKDIKSVISTYDKGEPDTISFEDRDQFVYCRHTGPFELEPLIELAREVNDYCKSHGYTATLVDVSKSIGGLMNIERFQHAEVISEFMSPVLKIALFVRYDQAMPNRPWENATRNRRMKTKVFTEKYIAEEWLQS